MHFRAFGQVPVLRYGSKGQDVASLQALLVSRGFSVGPSGADGDFGPDTLAAVKSFQAASGLSVDGIVGEQTWAALNASPQVTDAPIPSRTLPIQNVVVTEEEAEAIDVPRAPKSGSGSALVIGAGLVLAYLLYS